LRPEFRSFSVPDAPTLIDKRLMRRAFERAAGSYDAAAVLQHEVRDRMLERLDYIKYRPQTVLDAGTGTGGAIPALRERYPQAAVTALDIANAMLARARGRVPRWKSLLGIGGAPVHYVCGDIEALPLAPESMGLVWSNLALQWMNDPQLAFGEVHRVLAPGGLFMFSTFGPDTLKELRAAYTGIDDHTHVNRFTDMHDIGDLLVHGGFATPVMDMEVVTVTYAEVRGLMRDLKAIGAHNVTAGRPGGLTGRARLAALEKNYERFRRDGRLPATFEVVYGHAWKPEPRQTADGKPIIPIRPQP
jgi:malonyl-CoA O-methyltransferase